MGKKEHLAPLGNLDRLIYEIRGQKVMLDSDLAHVYGVTTKRLNEAVKRNPHRFPEDFVFRLNAQELAALRSQFATGSQKHRDPRFFPTPSLNMARSWQPMSWTVLAPSR
jgi:hypothetical protein